MLILGLTGGIASGKSTVSVRLRDQYGLTIVDADRIAREVVEPGKPAYNQIVKYFGEKVPGLVKEDKSLDRAALGRYVFSEKDELKVLNGITHPAVRKQIMKEVFLCYIRFNTICVLDVPLLFEARMDQFCGKTMSVVCDHATQLKRLMKRNPELSKQDCENRIQSQMSNEERAERSDLVLVNDSTMDHLYSELDKDIKTIQPWPVWAYLEVICPPLALLSGALSYIAKAFNKRSTSAKPHAA